MATDAVWIPHLRLSFGGSLGTPGIEIWSNTLRFFEPGQGPPRSQLVQAATDCVTPIQDWFARLETGIAGVAHLEWVKLNWVTANGSQRDSDTVMADASAAGNLTNANPPWYQTQAITLRTPKKRGRSHSGRIFPPTVQFTAQLNSPYEQVSYAGAKLTSFNTMIKAVKVAMGLVFSATGGLSPDLAIFSPGSILKATAALWTPVSGIELDLVPDVQHRRTNRVPRVVNGPIPLTP